MTEQEIEDNIAIATVLMQLLANYAEGYVQFTKVDMYNKDTAPDEFEGGLMIFCKGEPVAFTAEDTEGIIKNLFHSTRHD